MDYTDQPKEIRKGEELETAKLEAFLKDSISGLEGDLNIRQFPGGHSNLTYHLTVGEREMVLRRPPFGTKVKSAHDMGREYRVLDAVNPVYPYAPRPLAYTEDTSIMGCPFYVMERIKGVVIRRELPKGLTLTPDQVRELIRNMVQAQYELHALDYREIGLGDLGKPQGYLRRQVEGWNRRYRDARTPDAPDGEEVMNWLEEHIPPDSGRAALIHNDFKLDNMILNEHDPARIVGVLDWEMATLGDPVMDLCTSLLYMVDPGDPPEMKAMSLLPSVMEQGLTREDLVRLYEELSGREIGDIEYYFCFGLFRLAVIGQQIYYRYYHGHTKDERFAMFIFGTNALIEAVSRAIEQSDL